MLFMLSVTNKPFMLSVIVFNVIMTSIIMFSVVVHFDDLVARINIQTFLKFLLN
jgi:hypothetical protein